MALSSSNTSAIGSVNIRQRNQSALVAKALWLRCRMFTEPIALVFDELSAMRDDPDLHPRALAYVGVDLPTISWHVCRPHVGLAAVEPLELPERGAVDTVRL